MFPVKIKNVKKVLVLIDYANLLSSVRYLKKHIDMKVFYDYLSSLSYVKDISIYYGTDPRNPKSKTFINWLKKTGCRVITKDVKYIKVDIRDLLGNVKNKMLISKLDKGTITQLENNIQKLEAKGILFETQKCNLDVELSLDIYKSLNKYDGYILISGDGDFVPIIKIARSKGKFVSVLSLRKFLAGELVRNCDMYVNLLSLKKVKGLFVNPKKVI